MADVNINWGPEGLAAKMRSEGLHVVVHNGALYIGSTQEEAESMAEAKGYDRAVGPDMTAICINCVVTDALLQDEAALGAYLVSRVKKGLAGG